MSHSRSPLLAGVILACSALPAAAQQSSSVSETTSQQDETIVVTATRAPDARADIAVATSVLTAEDLQAAQAVIVSDVLARTPGIAVTRNGGPGTTTQLRIRGAESDQTVVLIDGVKLNDPSSTGGGYNFANLLAGDIAQIEVLRGPQSTLWGSQAIGGVVNILTASPQGPLSGAVSVEGGSYATAFARAHAGLGGDWGGFRLAASQFTSSGFSAFDDDLGGGEDDGFRNTSLSSRLDLNLTDWAALDLRAAYFGSRADIDGFPPPSYSFADTPEYAETTDLVGYGGVRVSAFGGALENRLGLAYTQTDRDNFDPSSSVPTTFDARGTNSRLEYQGTWNITDNWHAVFGAESERSWFRTASPSTFDPNPAPERHAVTQDSFYGQMQAHPITGLTLTGGARFDDHETFGDATTYQAGAAYALNDGATILRANYGEGFKAPSLYQIYSSYGNLALEPEEAEGWDIGVEQRLLDGMAGISLTYFDRDTTNQIDFRSCVGAECATRPFGLYDNTARTHADGVELEASLHLGERLTLSGNYTWLNAENRSPGSANFGNDLPRRAEQTGLIEATYIWPIDLSTTLAVQYVGDSFDNASNSFQLGGYTLFDLRASYPLSDTIDLYGRIENITDETYETIRRYGTAGRAAYVGARLRFE